MKARLLSAAAAALILALALAALPLALPRLWGWQVYSILTGSMEPALPVGSAIYVQEWEAGDLQPGDVITFTLGNATSLVETHRVVENDAQAGQLITKGDANAEPDINPVAYDRVVGKVVFCIPFLGNVARLFRTGAGMAACAGVLVAAGALWALADRIKNREKFQ